MIVARRRWPLVDVIVQALTDEPTRAAFDASVKANQASSRELARVSKLAEIMAKGDTSLAAALEQAASDLH